MKCVSVALMVAGIAFYIWVAYFKGTKPAEPTWPSGKPKAATDAEIKAKSFEDFKAALEAKVASGDQSAIVEMEIRRVLKKPTGKLTKADLDKVQHLSFFRFSSLPNHRRGSQRGGQAGGTHRA